ncbi:NAD-dependent epimerase/dehydratase family protein [Natronoflexus pectinivorans]|uniref:Nucleoside-diphosphate-sugar epimerase n=1 Tax=Natronoflexus pectinivorans TaxID=682526 RepID=A0A4R2GJQ2_9BACT|nr:NAD-dependent epimerase/dehydratase family protein [Natronoflexus pectinivorans]TCO08274.1 nucleoside-diphosphate-sugar epimerase [Natronoflexus pectinivorans]
MILVTGGTGLVGSHLLYHLTNEGLQVKAIYRKQSNLEEVKQIFAYYNQNWEQLFNRIQWVEADLSDYYALEDALQGVKQVYHAGAKVSFNPGESDKMLKTNTEGTANLMNACLKQNVEKVCYVSSISSLGKQIDGGLITEEVEWQPDDYRSAYSYSKFRAEMEVWRASKEGLNVVIVNPSVIIGPVNWLRSSGRLFYSVKRGMPFYTYGATGFVDVRDVAKAIHLLMNSDAVNERFILNGENLPFSDFFKMVAKEMNKKPPFIKVSKCITEIGWRVNLMLCFLVGKSPAITKDSARAAQSVSKYSADKFSNRFNYTFMPIEESVKNAAEWFKIIEANDGKIPKIC